jgi:hypothetical protein
LDVVTLTSILLIAGSGAFGIFLIVFGLRGALKIWRRKEFR